MHFLKFKIVLVVFVFSFDHIRSSPQHYAPVADADEGVNDTDQGVDDSDEGVNDTDQGVDDSDEGVNDTDDTVNDTDDTVNDTDQGVDDADDGVNDVDKSVSDTSVEAPESKCLQEHEEYDSCGSSCPANCDDYKEKVKTCYMMCVQGCFCKAGYIRNPKDNTCIKPEQCPKTPPIRIYNQANKKSKIVPISDQCKPGQYFYTKGCNICYCYAEGTQGCTDIVCKQDKKMTLLGKPKQTQAYKKLRDTATACVPGEKFTSNGCNCNCVIPSVMTCDKSCVTQ